MRITSARASKRWPSTRTSLTNVPLVLESTTRYPLGVCTISAWRRETSFPETTTSQVASRPNTSEAPAMAYSRPSVNDTTRPPVLAVAWPALAFAIASGRFIAWTYCVLPLRRSSTNVSSWPATSTLSPWSNGVGSAPRRTPLINTSAAGTALAMTTCPSGIPLSLAWRGSTPATVRWMAQAGSLPKNTSPAGIVYLRPPISSNAMHALLPPYCGQAEKLRRAV